MKSSISFGLLSGALALTSDRVEHVHQKALLTNACPSDSILVDGACQLASYEAPGILTSTVPYGSNISQASQTLDEARKAAEQAADFPWTFWPECFSNDQTKEPYCVFSHQDFAGGRGVFILTTKPAAYAMLDKPAFTHPEILANTNRYDNPPFVQQNFQGKGRGLVANKTLHRGDQIFASTPILITDSDAYDLSKSERYVSRCRHTASRNPKGILGTHGSLQR
jgi:hypothetical protein